MKIIFFSLYKRILCRNRPWQRLAIKVFANIHQFFTILQQNINIYEIWHKCYIHTHTPPSHVSLAWHSGFMAATCYCHHSSTIFQAFSPCINDDDDDDIASSLSIWSLIHLDALVSNAKWKLTWLDEDATVYPVNPTPSYWLWKPLWMSNTSWIWISLLLAALHILIHMYVCVSVSWHPNSEWWMNIILQS